MASEQFGGVEERFSVLSDGGDDDTRVTKPAVAGIKIKIPDPKNGRLVGWLVGWLGNRSS